MPELSRTSSKHKRGTLGYVYRELSAFAPGSFCRDIEEMMKMEVDRQVPTVSLLLFKQC